MEENEKKKKDYSTLSKGIIIVLVLALILFNASKLFTYIGSKHTVETGPPPEGTVVTKAENDSLMELMQGKLDVSKHQNDSLRSVIVEKDTELQKKSDSIVKAIKRKPVQVKKTK